MHLWAHINRQKLQKRIQEYNQEVFEQLGRKTLSKRPKETQRSK
jgi:hypothetical protein